MVYTRPDTTRADVEPAPTFVFQTGSPGGHLPPDQYDGSPTMSLRFGPRQWGQLSASPDAVVNTATECGITRTNNRNMRPVPAGITNSLLLLIDDIASERHCPCRFILRPSTVCRRKPDVSQKASNLRVERWWPQTGQELPTSLDTRSNRHPLEVGFDGPDFSCYICGCLAYIKVNGPVKGSDSRTVEDLTTDELVALVRDERRTEYYEEIVRRFQRDVLRIVSGMLYERSATEDLVQQVFVNAFLHLKDYQTGRDFGRWIRTIARNAVREHVRKASRYDRRLKAYGEILGAREDDERAADQDQERQQALEPCLEQLSERASEAVKLRYHEGKSFAMIAPQLQSTTGAIRNLLARVRAQLRECIERRMSEAREQ